MSIFLFSFIFSFYRKYSYYDVFVESLFWIFFYMIELYSKTKSNKNEGYIYKWIYINYYKHLPKLLPSPDSKCVFRTETVILLFFFPILSFSISLVIVFFFFAVITQHHSRTHLSFYPLTLPPPPLFFFNFFAFVKNQKFIYWVGSLYTIFISRRKKKKKRNCWHFCIIRTLR